MGHFELVSEYQHNGNQLQAIEEFFSAGSHFAGL